MQKLLILIVLAFGGFEISGAALRSAMRPAVNLTSRSVSSVPVKKISFSAIQGLSSSQVVRAAVASQEGFDARVWLAALGGAGLVSGVANCDSIDDQTALEKELWDSYTKNDSVKILNLISRGVLVGRPGKNCCPSNSRCEMDAWALLHASIHGSSYGCESIVFNLPLYSERCVLPAISILNKYQDLLPEINRSNGVIDQEVLDKIFAANWIEVRAVIARIIGEKLADAGISKADKLLCQAVGRGDVDAVRMAIVNGVNVNILRDKYWHSDQVVMGPEAQLTMIGSMAMRLGLFLGLLADGENILESLATTPLFVATLQGDGQVLEALYNAGIKVRSHHELLALRCLHDEGKITEELLAKFKKRASVGTRIFSKFRRASGA